MRGPHFSIIFIFFLVAKRQDLNGKGHGGVEQARKLRDFFTALALCHTVIPERFEDTDEVRARVLTSAGCGNPLTKLFSTPRERCPWKGKARTLGASRPTKSIIAAVDALEGFLCVMGVCWSFRGSLKIPRSELSTAQSRTQGFRASPLRYISVCLSGVVSFEMRDALMAARRSGGSTTLLR